MKRLHPVLVVLALAACGKSAPAPPAAGSQGAARPTGPQDQRLIAAAMIALPPEGLAAESLPDAQSRGAQLMVAYCTQCHALPSPATHAPQDWPSVARRMWIRIDMMHGELGVAVPTSADRVQLLNYLLANALRVAENLPAGAGRDVFQERCSRCHTLPDPRSHSPADWPSVVMRMERNMERMKVSGVTPQQAQAIILYLEGASRRGS